MDQPVPEVEQFDIIQIDPDSDVRDEFKGKLAVVDEPRNWGCVAYVETFEGRAYVRLKSETYVRVGKLEWIPADDVQDEQSK